MNSATLAHTVVIEGQGLFSGQPCRAEVRPARDGCGIVFVRDDLRVLCHPDSFIEHPNCTVMEADGARIMQTEHMLCALWAAGIDTAEIIVSGLEMPNHDGSALPLHTYLIPGGFVEHGAREELIISEPIRVDGGNGAFISIVPAENLQVSYHFAHPELGEQLFAATITRAMAIEMILPARTFITEKEAQIARDAGLIQNDDETAALLIRDVANPPALRFTDEYARHKVLDLLGDLYAVPMEITGHITCHRSGHALNRQLARALVALSR